MESTGDIDDGLMARASEGDEEAFVTLYNRHKDFVYRLIFFRCSGDKALTEDLAQDVWSKVFKQPNYQPQGNKFKYWLSTLCRNEVINHWRKCKISTVNLSKIDDPPDPKNNPEKETDLKEKFRILIELLKRLPVEQQDAMVLYLSGMKIAEIAKTAEVGLETAKTRVRYAKEKLKCWANEITNGSNDE